MGVVLVELFRLREGEGPFPVWHSQLLGSHRAEVSLSDRRQRGDKVNPFMTQTVNASRREGGGIFVFVPDQSTKGYQITLIRIAEVSFIPRTRTLDLPLLSQILNDPRRPK